MDKDINNLEEIINLCKEEINNNDKNTTAILDLEDLKSLKNFLDKYKQLEEENKEIKKDNFKLKDELETKRKEYQETYKDVREELKELKEDKKNSIPKSKVKEKIEELETKKKEYGFGSIESMLFLNKIQVLQELLGKE